LFSCDIDALSATIRKSLTNDTGAITQFEPDPRKARKTRLSTAWQAATRIGVALDGIASRSILPSLDFQGVKFVWGLHSYISMIVYW